MSQLGMHGTYLERLHEALRFAHDNRGKAFDRADDLRPEIERDLLRVARASGRTASPSDREISFALDSRLAKDPRFTGSVANERWGMRLANTYALVELLYAQRHANELAAKQILVQRRTHDLLEKLLQTPQQRLT